MQQEIDWAAGNINWVAWDCPVCINAGHLVAAYDTVLEIAVVNHEFFYHGILPGPGDRVAYRFAT